MFRNYILGRYQTVKDAIELMDKKNVDAVMISDESLKLLGIFTKGDMRRYILKNNNLQECICHAMNSNPKVFASRYEAEKACIQGGMVVYPVVTNTGIITDCLFAKSLNEDECISNVLENIPLVIMAGGKGTRLYPYTQILPKALMPIGDYSITERIINKFVRWGCKDVYLIINHKANMIKSYFEDLERQYNLYFIKEEEFLGTGGGLSLLKNHIKTKFILSNCDILVEVDYECLIKTHENNKNIITFVGAMKEVVIPYGVITTNENGQIEKLTEKPGFSFITNTGVYVLENKVIQDQEENEFIHITDIAQRYVGKGENVGVFPISEKNWLDMGQFKEMKHMMRELGIEK